MYISHYGELLLRHRSSKLVPFLKRGGCMFRECHFSRVVPLMASEDIWGVFGTRLVLAFAQLQANNKPASSTKDIKYMYTAKVQGGYL